MPTKTFFNLPEVKRNNIEAIAIDEFAANPFAIASVNTIVTNAKIAKGSFYQYFTDKEDLYNHLLTIVQKNKLELVSNLTPPSNHLDFFDYLRWMLQIAVLFELRQPKLARIEHRAFLERTSDSSEDSDRDLTVGGKVYFIDLLTQGILHDDIATWVDTDMTVFLLSTIYHQVGGYLISRMGENAKSFADGSLDIRNDPIVQDLFDNLMDLLEAGMARDPQIRKDFYSK